MSALQLLNALILIEREGPLGRRALSHALQIKDGVARGLMERLAESKTVRVMETGVELSQQGRQSLHRLLRQLSIKKILPVDGSDLITNSPAMSILVTRGYRPGMTGISQRDEAIKAGADGAITIAALGKKLVLPPDNKSLADLAPKENARLKEALKPADRDLILIGFGKDSSHALSGALAAVFSLQAQ